MSVALSLRRSAIEAFACPYRHRTIYVDGVADDSDEAIRGRAFHAAARRYIEALWATRQRDDLALAEEAFERGMLDVRTPAHLLPEVSFLYWERWAPDFELDLDAYVVHEKRHVDAMGFSWTPDLLYAHDDLLEIPDFKTYFNGFDDAQAKRELQARLYAASARRLYPGFRQYRVVFLFVRWGFSAAATFDAADLDLVDRELEIMRKTIALAHERNDWPAIPGAHCGFCRLRCPLEEQIVVQPVQLTSQAQAVRIAGQILVLEQATRARRKALEAWCAGEGAVRVGEIEWAHRPTPKTTFPIAEVWRVLEEQGITPSFTVSKSALRSYLTTQRFAHVRDDLEALAQVRHGTKFTARRVGAVEDELPSGEDGGE